VSESASAVGEPGKEPPGRTESWLGRLASRLSATEVEFAGIALILVGVVVVFSLISDRFLTVDNGRNILETVSVVGSSRSARRS
jgi:hypothetical protein